MLNYYNASMFYFKLSDTVNHCKTYTINYGCLKSLYFVHVKDFN